METNIKKNIIDFDFNKYVELPQIIIKPNDVFYFTERTGKPNFFGDKIVEKEIYYLEKNNFKILDNKVICIKGADPGYDFIFDHQISGLITEYGGANSHMSIRCSELNIPAAIGVGSIIFNNIIKSKKLILIQLEKNYYFIMKILIIPTIREIYKNQFEFCIDLKLLIFLKKVFKSSTLETYNFVNKKDYDLLVLAGGNNSIIKSKADKLRDKINNSFLNTL